MNSLNEQYEMLERAAQREPRLNRPSLAEGCYCSVFHDGRMAEATPKGRPFASSWLYVGLTLGASLLCTAVLMLR